MRQAVGPGIELSVAQALAGKQQGLGVGGLLHLGLHQLVHPVLAGKLGTGRVPLVQQLVLLGSP